MAENFPTIGQIVLIPKGGDGKALAAAIRYLSMATYANIKNTGRSDYVWFNHSTGAIYFWTFNATGGLQSGDLVTTTGSDWVPAGFGDFNGDGKDELGLYNTLTAEWGYFTIGADGVTPAWVPLSTVSDREYHPMFAVDKWSQRGTRVCYLAGDVGINTITGLAKLAINGGVHVGGDSDPGDNNLAVDGAITGMTDIYTVGWTDYSATSTITGWASYTNKEIFYKLIGKTCIVHFWIKGNAHASSTAATFTLPYSARAGFSQYQGQICQAMNNGVNIVSAIWSLPASGNTVTCYWWNGTTFTATWTTGAVVKQVIGTIIFEIA